MLPCAGAPPALGPEPGVPYRRPCAMTSRRAPRLVILAAALAAVIAGCAGGVAGPSTTPRPGPVTLPDQAVARVIATEPRLAGIEPLATDAIGQASWYGVAPASGVGVFVVDVRVGWGDCQAGCISEHSWVYAIGPDGAVSIVSETGDPVPPEAWPSPIGAGRTGIRGLATAGPVCPVERVPPDPACAPRPVVGAKLVIRDASGSEVAKIETGPDGAFFIELKPGEYVVEPQPVEGLMGTAAPQHASVGEGNATVVQLDYDTGIR